MALHKHDIINGIARARGLSRYLEIASPSTGGKFRFVDPDLFTVRDRLLYRCPETYDDGGPVAFRTTAHSSHELVRAIGAMQPEHGRYDLIFVDSWHGLVESSIDLHGALSLLQPGGIIVAHDCNPTDPASVGNEFAAGSWCGLTYQAFIDFVLAAEPAGYCVIDTDYGCGIVFTAPAAPPPTLPCSRPDRRLVFDWVIARASNDTRFPFFDRHRAQLLNIVTPAAFGQAFGVPIWSARTHPTVNLVANPCWHHGMDHWAAATDTKLVATPGGACLTVAEAPPGSEIDATWPTPLGAVPGRIYDAGYTVTPGHIYEAQAVCKPRQGRVAMLLLLLDEHGKVLASPRVETREGATTETLVVRTEAPPGTRFATLLLRLVNPAANPAPLEATVTQLMLAETVADADEDLIWTDHA